MNRTKYWWLWPDFYEKKDAFDAAKMGVIACGLVAVVTGITFGYRYYNDSDIYQLLGGLIFSIVFCVLGYGIFKMSRVAGLVALLLFSAEMLYKIATHGKLGIAPLLLWYLVQSNRAIFWFKNEKNKVKA